MPSANQHRDHLRYNLLTAQYPLPHPITFTETTDHLHRNPQARSAIWPRRSSHRDMSRKRF